MLHNHKNYYRKCGIRLFPEQLRPLGVEIKKSITPFRYRHFRTATAHESQPESGVGKYFVDPFLCDSMVSMS